MKIHKPLFIIGLLVFIVPFLGLPGMVETVVVAAFGISIMVIVSTLPQKQSSKEFVEDVVEEVVEEVKEQSPSYEEISEEVQEKLAEVENDEDGDESVSN